MYEHGQFSPEYKWKYMADMWATVGRTATFPALQSGFFLQIYLFYRIASKDFSFLADFNQILKE